MRALSRFLRLPAARIRRGSGEASDLDPIWQFHSAVPGAVWPAVPVPAAATALALLYQLDRTQWLSPEALLERQLRQLETLLRHAYTTVPYYQEHWRARYLPDLRLTAKRFARLPLITRRHLQDNFEALKSRDVPSAHGTAQEQRTSGSTGATVRFLATPFNGLLWNAFTLRDHAWHRRDLSRKLAVIRRGSDAHEQDNWGMATTGIATGHAVGMSIHADVAEQLDWLEQQKPDYLLTYPSLLVELAKLSLQRGVRLPGLLHVRAFAETLPSEARGLCREAWGVPLVDMYSASEMGYIGLQCPAHEHYHVQSEGVLVEVLDDDGAPCRPGHIGRVVVTALHNFAMPLVRYDIGDFAEPGELCACGRGLPVLRRILGRARNTLVTADGRRYWPVLSTRKLVDIALLRQHQFVQKSYDFIEVKLVTAAPIRPDQEERMRRQLLSQLPSGMRLGFSYVDRIPRNSGGKFEDFISEVSAALR